MLNEDVAHLPAACHLPSPLRAFLLLVLAAGGARGTHFIDLAAGPRIRAHLAQTDEALRRGDRARADAHLDDAERLLE